MKTFLTNNFGRIVIIHLEKGDCILESVNKELERLQLKNGILLSAIGSLRKATLHYIASTEDLALNKFLTIESPIELSSAQGLIINGEPHFHLTLSDPQHVYTGHMENGCEVQYLAELAILELTDLNLTRKLNEFGISYFDNI
mgnify:FL=1